MLQTAGKLRRLRIARLPGSGPVTSDCFEMIEEPLPQPGEGQVLARIVYLSVDAGTRASLDLASEYVVARGVGDAPMGSGAVAEVIASNHPDFAPGDIVTTGVTDYASHLLLDPADTGTMLRRIDPGTLPLSAFAGVLGITGFTSWCGVFRCFALRAGECFVVSAAAGAVGIAAGQFAKIAGARVVGIAGGYEKCAWLMREAGFDAAVDYKADLSGGLDAACPQGIDFYFDNVGGAVTDAVLARMNALGRVAVCGQMVEYDGSGPARGPGLMIAVLKRLSIRGFLSVIDFPEALPQFREEAGQWLREGRIGNPVSVVDGLDNAAEAINRLMRGANIGKQLIKVGSEPGEA